MNSNYLISVIIPIYNTEQYLERCLDSALNNTYKNIELICVNDGSTDNSLAIIENKAESDDRIKIIDKKTNTGICNSRDIGIQNASGDFVLFIDSDDWIHERCIELLLKAQAKNDSDITICRPYITSEYLDDAYESDSVNAKILTIEELFDDDDAKTWRWGKLYRTSILQNRIFPQLPYGEDKAFNIRVICTSEQITCAMIDNKLYYHYRREESITSSADIEDIYLLGDYCIRQIGELNNDQLKREILVDAYKAYLSARYSASVKKNADKKKYNDAFIKLRSIMKECNMPVRQRVIYTMLVAFPNIYRYYRILNDKTLINWEKDQKK